MNVFYDRPFYVIVACQPEILNARFCLFQSDIMFHTNRFACNQVIVSGARSRQGRA